MSSIPDRIWLWIAASLYLAGFILGTVALLRERRHSRAWMYLFISIGFAFQTFGLALRGKAVHGCPITNTFELFQFTAWSATSLYLVIGPTFRLSLLGYFTGCLSATLTFVSLLIPVWDSIHRVNGAGASPWIEFHAALALFSYGVFALLALTSIMYLLQVFSLKSQHLRGFFSFLPSVVDLDKINLRLLTTGVVLLSAALLVGYVQWVQDRDRVPVLKIAITGSIWAAYAVAYVQRLRGVLLTKRLAWTCIVLFVAALFSFEVIESSRRTAPTVQTASQP